MRSVPALTSSTQSAAAGSVPELDRRKITRSPSGDTVNVLGAPLVKRPVRAY